MVTRRGLADVLRKAGQLTEAIGHYEAMLQLSRNDNQANRDHGLRAPILLEAGFELGPRVGIQGTPSAVRVDADGRLDSDVAVGADAGRSVGGNAPFR